MEPRLQTTEKWTTSRKLCLNVKLFFMGLHAAIKKVSRALVKMHTLVLKLYEIAFGWPRMNHGEIASVR